MPRIPDPEILTPQEAARIVPVSSATIRKLCQEGMLKAYRAGVNWRIEKKTLLAFAKEQGMPLRSELNVILEME